MAVKYEFCTNTFHGMAQIWKPHVTVAAVIEQAGNYLLVEEKIGDRICYNQPAGHLEEGETLFQAVTREVLEETAYHFVPQYLVGIYHWKRSDATFIRFTFGGTITGHDPARALDKEIIATHWLSPEAIKNLGEKLRSPMVSQCFNDHLEGKRYPLQLLTHL